MFEGKYNKVMDSAMVRLSMQAAIFCTWMFVAYAALAAK
jgi:hypothetical protein